MWQFKMLNIGFINCDKGSPAVAHERLNYFFGAFVDMPKQFTAGHVRPAAQLNNEYGETPQGRGIDLEEKSVPAVGCAPAISEI